MSPDPSLIEGWAFAGLVGLTSRPKRVAAGTTSCNNSKRFGLTSPLSDVAPVMFPPGLLRLATNPEATGSAPISKTIGIVDVAALAANAPGKPPGAAITAT